MKYLLDLSFILITQLSFSQTADTLKTQTSKKEKVSFVTRVDIEKAGKDGIYMEGYVVNIDYEKAKKLDGKTIRVTGKVTIIQGLKNFHDGVIRQGREQDTKYINAPRIKILKS